MDKFRKNETSCDNIGRLPSFEDDRPSLLQRVLMLVAVLVLPLVGSFALNEQPSNRVSPVELSIADLPRETVSMTLAELDEKN